MTALLGLPSAIGCILACAVAFLVHRRRLGPAGRFVALGSLGAAWWCLGQIIWIPVQDPGFRVWLGKVQYFGIASTPVFWFLGSVTYTGSRFWRSGARRAALWIIPAITVVLALTNESHKLIWESFDPVPGVPRAIVTYGAWFKVHAVYSYALVLLGTVVVASRLFTSPAYRPQFVAILLGPAAVLCGNLLHLTARSRLPIDPTPSTFALSFALFGWAVLRYRLFETAPLARDRTLESLREGVVALDQESRVVDVNRAALSLLALETPPLGSPLAEILPALKDGSPLPGVAIRLPRDRWAEIEITSVESGDGTTEGRAVLIRDVTEVREAQERLRLAQQELERLNRELDAMAHTDALTGLANRRRFETALADEISRARRHERSLSLLLLDIDHFKRVNDERGHPAGDRVLATLGRSVASQLRPGDTAARYGGEEFALVLPDADAADALAIARRLRDILRTLDHRDEAGVAFRVTVSCGVATLAAEDTQATLVARADRGLYFIKNSGRDGIGTEEAGAARRVND